MRAGLLVALLGLNLEGLKNARDLGESLPSSCGVLPGKVVRSSALTNGASPQYRGFRTLLDLRSEKELLDDPKIFTKESKDRRRHRRHHVHSFRSSQIIEEPDDGDALLSPSATFDGHSWVKHSSPVDPAPTVGETDAVRRSAAELLHVSLLDEHKVLRTASKRLQRPRLEKVRSGALIAYAKTLRLVSRSLARVESQERKSGAGRDEEEKQEKQEEEEEEEEEEKKEEEATSIVPPRVGATNYGSSEAANTTARRRRTFARGRFPQSRFGRRRGRFSEAVAGLARQLERCADATDARARRPFMDVVNAGGLVLLNECVLDESPAALCAALQVCADPDRQPVALFCTAGKDRTGLIVALLICALFIDDVATASFADQQQRQQRPPLLPLRCSVEREGGQVEEGRRVNLTAIEQWILDDYEKSDAIYNSLDDQAMVAAMECAHLDPKMFLGAPRQVMKDTLALVRARGAASFGTPQVGTPKLQGPRGGGTGEEEVVAYLDSIGFNVTWRWKLRSTMLGPRLFEA